MSIDLAAKRSGLMDSQPESKFDRLTRLASLLLEAPVALIALVDHSRQYFKSQEGLPAALAELRETPLSHSFCQFVMISDEPLVVGDAREHPVLRENRAVLELGVVAYAGVPLHNRDGEAMGAFCAIDSVPRQWTEEQVTALRILAAQATEEMEESDAKGEALESLDRLKVSEKERRRQTRLAIHDMRTPLNSAMLAIRGMKLAGPLSKDQQSCVDLAARNLRALALTLENLADIGSAVQSDSDLPLRERVSAESLVRSAVLQLKPFADSNGIEFRVTEHTAGDVSVDRARMLRAIMNAIGNAIRFTPRGGHITIDCRAVGGTPPAMIELSILAGNIAGAERYFAAPKAHDDRLDERADPRLENIGLSFAKRIVESHLGRVTVRSNPERGTTFIIQLPLLQTVSPSLPCAENAATSLTA